GDAAEFYVHQGILHNFLGGRVDHDALSPITAALGNKIGRPGAVLGEAQAHQGSGAVLGEGVGVQKDLFGAFPIGPVDHILVLEVVVPVVVGILAFFERGTHLFVVPKLFQTVFVVLPKGVLVQVAEGDPVLFLYPGLGLGTAVILEPTVGVGHFGAKIGVHCIDFLGGRVVHNDRFSFCVFITGRKNDGQGQGDQLFHFLGLSPLKIP